jgi:hypothetical protein
VSKRALHCLICDEILSVRESSMRRDHLLPGTGTPHRLTHSWPCENQVHGR